MTIIQHAIWFYHRFPLSDRDVQELLHQRGIEANHETLCKWCIKFEPLFAEDLRHKEPRRSSLWHLDEVGTSVDGVRHWLWRAVDEYGFVLDIFLQRHRDTAVAKTFLAQLLADDVPEVIDTDQLRSSGAAIRELPSLVNVRHQQVIPPARCSNIIEQSYRPTRRQEQSRQGFGRRKCAQEFLSLHARVTNLHHHSRTSGSASTRRQHQNHVFQMWSAVAAGAY